MLFVCSKSFPAKIFVGGGRLLTQALFSTKSAPASCLRVHVNTVGTWPHCVCNICDWTEMYVLLYQVSSSCCFDHVGGCCSCNLNILCVYRPKFNSTWKVCTCLVCTCLVCTCFVMYLLVSSQLLVAVLSTWGWLPRQLKLSLKRFAVSPELAYSTARCRSLLF